MSDNQSRMVLHDDEVDIVELMQGLWAQKFEILVITIVSLIIAVGYSMTVTPVFTSQVSISPGSIQHYGAIAGEYTRGSGSASRSPLTPGAALSNDAFRLYLSNLESMQVRSAFNSQLKSLGAVVSIKVNKGKATNFLDGPATLIAESTDRLIAKDYLEEFVRYTADATVLQFNEYLEGMEINQALMPSALFTVEQAAALSEEPIKPKRKSILLVGLVFGFIFGVLVGLVRFMVRKRIASANVAVK